MDGRRGFTRMLNQHPELVHYVLHDTMAADDVGVDNEDHKGND